MGLKMKMRNGAVTFLHGTLNFEARPGIPRHGNPELEISREPVFGEDNK